MCCSWVVLLYFFWACRSSLVILFVLLFRVATRVACVRWVVSMKLLLLLYTLFLAVMSLMLKLTVFQL